MGTLWKEVETSDPEWRSRSRPANYQLSGKRIYVLRGLPGVDEFESHNLIQGRLFGAFETESAAIAAKLEMKKEGWDEIEIDVTRLFTKSPDRLNWMDYQARLFAGSRSLEIEMSESYWPWWNESDPASISTWFVGDPKKLLERMRQYNYQWLAVVHVKGSDPEAVREEFTSKVAEWRALYGHALESGNG